MEAEIVKKNLSFPAEALRGQSPIDRGKEKERRCLEWVYRWGFSSAEMIRQVSGQARRGYATELVKKLLLVETKTANGMNPKKYYTLSQHGLNQVQKIQLALHDYPELDQYRVNQQQITHYLLAQQATINAIRSGLIDYDGYATERMTNQAGDKLGVKRPDVVWKKANGEFCGVEVELSGKWGRKMDQFIESVLRSIRKSTYSEYYVFTDTPAIEERYSKAFKPGEPFTIWMKNSRGYWSEDSTEKIPDWVDGKVLFAVFKNEK